MMIEQLDLFEIVVVTEVEEVIEVVAPETLVKTRNAEMSTRGIYVQDMELLQTVFQVGTYFEYETNLETKTVNIVPSDVKGKNTVSKRKVKDILKPVIDIRRKSVLATFEGCDKLTVNIFENRIEIVGGKQQ